MWQTSDDCAGSEEFKVITIHNRTNSPLLCLPAEIRNQIYGYVLKDTFELCVKNSCARGRSDPTIHGFGHAHFPRHLLYLLEACQQTHAEARLLLFRVNALHGDHEAIDKFLWGDKQHVFTVDQISNLRVVKFSVSDFYFVRGSGNTILGLGGIIKGTIERLKQLPDLQNLVITICREVSPNDNRALPETYMTLIRQQVEDLVKQESDMIKIKIKVMESREVAATRRLGYF
ncbi:hypothetical protein IQ06DRAFT_342243 [Phaeosphaeriaceae sp. SRC1lsM3a]|nr:hypothetical protein IQ06DRAFT_342243 [Stagonospora sp. SRC1lsM3a]